MRLRAVPVRDGGFADPGRSCPPERLAVSWRKIVLASFPRTGSSGISRACSIGGRGEHKVGRAWDWTVSVNDADDRAAARKVFTWLLRADAHVHFSFSWAGARKQTSHWDGSPVIYSAWRYA